MKRPRPQDWWSPQLDESSLRSLMERRDAPGVVFFGAWLAAVCGTTWALYWSWQSWWVIPALLIHGAVLSFSYAASHECAHRTAFKSAWLNESVFYITSFFFGEEPMVRRYSHGRHHAYTWFPNLDSQMPYRNPVSVRTYVRETLALTGLKDMYEQTLHLAFGSVPNEAGTNTVPASKIAQMRWGARGFLAGYLALIGCSVLLQSWFPIVAFFGGRAVGGWIVQLYINSQHMCMDESIADHRYSTRSLA
jgi:fatty acid desaturase